MNKQLRITGYLKKVSNVKNKTNRVMKKNLEKLRNYTQLREMYLLIHKTVIESKKRNIPRIKENP